MPIDLARTHPVRTAPARSDTAPSRTSGADDPAHAAPAPASGAGPDARLVALPQLEDGLPPTLAAVDDHLAGLERARQAQLDALPATPDSVVAAAHRRVVARYVDQVRRARARVRDGTYGSCDRCGARIPPRVLDREPWQTTCTECDPGVR